MNKKILLLIPLIAVAMGLMSIGGTTPDNPSMLGISYTGVSCVGINEIAEQGECSDNLFTRLGQNFTRRALIATTDTVINAIAAGNNTVAQAVGDVSLQGEWTTCGLSRATGTLTNITSGCTESTCAGNWSVTYEFTSTCNSVDVNATGLYDETTGNNLFAENTFTLATLQNSDKINITWFVWVS